MRRDVYFSARSVSPIVRFRVKTKIGARVSPVTRARKKSSARPFPLGTKGGITGFRSRARRTFPRPVRRLGFSRRGPRKRAHLSIPVVRNRLDRFDDAASWNSGFSCGDPVTEIPDLERPLRCSSDYGISSLLFEIRNSHAEILYSEADTIESTGNVAPDGFEPSVLVRPVAAATGEGSSECIYVAIHTFAMLYLPLLSSLLLQIRSAR